ncbi:pyridoxal 5'-phosphate synthase lyase subunit PdxS [Methanohalophilus portucalensis]|uniref:Pyridoxal 5'-phosphate synthase subunit PdxS n=2 Tax=Methanohalophilus portucalensis TaxID=39664 RepID=A0A1L9C7F4_9EURY|nr:pyridoxal 5'-phosphate synthase lyase subunit PdxS [Methanohalophilus portucalensis]ATU08921.1 pyridoxal biosynthesis lyase PdxS [Methanohalophilus portucalensis]OJH50328.1 pyridoxal phosphate synthase yaaD subunit [Methanohalophilus portucalensis FDF-1]RNI11234.1 pyridoxal 5'-phosphate synthase lyase subunit PdxS [Methanohalophilus portucalensis FDF-1]SMH29007.1 pyridoxal phosphate synthase yaaD subunit [Methanohalophilus portucalensis FDF-1]
MELENLRHGTELIKRGFARMQKGGVIMDVTNPEQARIAEEAGAVAVMALQAVPADIRKAGGVARMADPEIVAQIIDTVTIPVMAKARIGHFVEAEILESLGADMVDESEVLTPADEMYHIDKTGFTVPFVCGARDLGEALRRINEGAAMIRTKGEAGTGDVREAVRHMKKIMGEVRELAGKDKEELIKVARDIEAPIELVLESADLQRLPVVNFAAGGVATPADAALMMRLGADGVFVGSGIFKAENPEMMAKAVVEAVNNYDNPEKLAEISRGIGSGMKGMSADTILPEEALQTRGW